MHQDYHAGSQGTDIPQDDSDSTRCVCVLQADQILSTQRDRDVVAESVSRIEDVDVYLFDRCLVQVV